MQKGLKLVAQTNGSKQDLKDALAFSNIGLVSSIERIPLASIDVALDALKLGKVVGRQVISFS
jgi:propanol-preferring alcohol dehydrogenase